MNPGLYGIGGRPRNFLETFVGGGAHATGKHGGGGQHFTGQGFFCAHIMLSSRRNGVPMIFSIEPKQLLASQPWPQPLYPGPHIGCPQPGGGQGGGPQGCGGHGGGAQACGGQGCGPQEGGAQAMGAHGCGMDVGGGAAHFFGPTFTGIGAGMYPGMHPVGPHIWYVLAKASADHAAMRSTARVRTGAIRFLVIKLSFKHNSVNRLAQ
jgi:hypothetical protein